MARVVSRIEDNGFIDLNHQALVTLFYCSLAAVIILPLGMYPQVNSALVQDSNYIQNRLWVLLFSFLGGLAVSTAVLAQLSLVKLDRSIMFVQCLVQVVSVAALWLGEYILLTAENSLSIGSLATLCTFIIVYAGFS